MGNAAKSESAGLIDKRMLYTVDEVALLIGRTRKAIYHMIKRRQIPARKTGGGGRWGFIPEEIERWRKKGKATYAKI